MGFSTQMRQIYDNINLLLISLIVGNTVHLKEIYYVVAKEIYYGLIFPLAKQWQTIYDELTTTYVYWLIKLNGMNSEMTWNTESNII